MGTMIKGFWVTLSNIGGELDKAFCKNEDDLADAVQEISSCGLSAGDVIRVTEGESEDSE
jgi:hypothetical protein